MFCSCQGRCVFTEIADILSVRAGRRGDNLLNLCRFEEHPPLIACTTIVLAGVM